MNAITVIMLIFSLIAAVDRIFGSKLGLGKEFERGFMLLGTMALSMIGMIVISPLIADLLEPVFGFVSSTLGLDPSIIPASLFANDMGGATLAQEVAVDSKIGDYNAFIVSSMMGCTISFTIPFSLGAVKKEKHSELLFGMLCGIVTIPLGCFVSGIILKIPLVKLLLNLLPLVIFSLIIAFGLYFKPDMCIKIFAVFGWILNALITVGLALGVLNYLAKKELVPGLDSLIYGGEICLNAAAVMSGAFPLLFIVSKVLNKPLKAVGKKLGINETSALGIISSLATSVTTFGMMGKMDKKGAVINSAFAVSAAFTFAGHLAFTMAFDISYVPAMIVGKLVSGASAFVVALIFYNKSGLSKQ